MGRHILASALAVAMLAAPSAWASETLTFKTGNDLFEDCAAPVGDVRNSFCLGYVTGGSDMLSVLLSYHTISTEFCGPEGITIGQVADVFSKYLQDHPEKRHLSAAYLLSEALSHAFPCKKDAGKK